MYITDYLKENNVSKFEDVKNLLIKNNFIVKEDNSFISSLYLVYYKRIGEIMTPLQRECNGLILEKETNKIICMSYKKFYKDDSIINPQFNYNEEKDDIVLEKSEEGTLIRLFNYNNIWYFSTKKCIDARKSKWQSDKSFYELFMECSFNENLDMSKLVKTRNYFFIIKHPENSVVFNIEFEKLIHLTTFDLETFNEIGQDIGIDKSEKFDVVFMHEKDLLYHMKTTTNINYEGIIIYNKNNKNNKQKFKFDHYKKMRDIYGNTNSRFYKFLETRKNLNTLSEYISCFPHHVVLFKDFEHKYIHFCKYIHDKYLENKVFKTDFNIDRHFKKIIYDIHGIYLSNRIPITLTCVIDHVSTLHIKLQNYLYNRYIILTQD